MEYASKDIRNILVAGHAGCGKTTLTESLLYLSGATERMGRVEDGTTASDFDPEEARRKASLNSSVIPVESNGTKFNLIDVPGLFDFETGAAEGITAAESVLICVSGRSGVTVGAEKAYKLALKNNKARMVFVTKSDLENSDYFKILEQLKIKFGPSICPCVVPARLDDGTVAYINLFSQKAFKYESGKQVQIDLPDIGHRFEGLIQAMYEAIAETDETLMEKFFEGEPFTTEEIVTGMAAGAQLLLVDDVRIVPVNMTVDADDALHHRGDRRGNAQGRQGRPHHPRVLRQCRKPAGIGYAAVQHEGVAAQRRNRRCCWRKR